MNSSHHPPKSLYHTIKNFIFLRFFFFLLLVPSVMISHIRNNQEKRIKLGTKITCNHLNLLIIKCPVKKKRKNPSTNFALLLFYPQKKLLWKKDFKFNLKSFVSENNKNIRTEEYLTKSQNCQSKHLKLFHLFPQHKVDVIRPNKHRSYI